MGEGEKSATLGKRSCGLDCQGAALGNSFLTACKTASNSDWVRGEEKAPQKPPLGKANLDVKGSGHRVRCVHGRLRKKGRKGRVIRVSRVRADKHRRVMPKAKPKSTAMKEEKSINEEQKSIGIGRGGERCITDK